MAFRLSVDDLNRLWKGVFAHVQILSGGYITGQYEDLQPHSRKDVFVLVLTSVSLVIVFTAAHTILRGLRSLPTWLWERWKLPQVKASFPPEIAPSWKSRIIKKPNLLSHLADPTLVPAEESEKDRDQKFVTCYDPATAYHIATLPLPTREGLKDLIGKANTAYSKHRSTTFSARRRFLRSFKKWMLDSTKGPDGKSEANLRKIVRVAVRDTGKTEVDATFGELLTVLAKIDYLLQQGEQALAPEKRPGNLLLAHKVSRVCATTLYLLWSLAKNGRLLKVHYEPLGVVCAIVSWNYPVHNVLAPILASLFTGNTVVVKCSESVYWSTQWIIGVLKQTLAACDMDPEAVQLVCCFPEDAEVITKHPDIKHITFIGSEPVGKMVAKAAAENLTPVCIELGGKDCAVILPSADVNFFASTWMRAAFQANGQNCIGIERFIVHRSIYSKFVEIMKPRVQSLRCGPPLVVSEGDSPATYDCGAMISDRLFGDLETLLRSAEKEGARVLAGGKRYRHAEFAHGHYFEPTLLVDVTAEMQIARNEVFAPVMTVIPYDTVEEAVHIANSTRYGLGSAVFGGNRKEAMRVAHRLNVGMVAVNDFGVFYLNQAMPFGGVKASGYGRFGGPEGLRAICNPKAITEDRWFSLIRTAIPRPVGSASWTFLDGLIRLAFGMSLWERIRGLKGLAVGGLSAR